MNSSLAGRLGEKIETIVSQTAADYSSAKPYVSIGDRVLGDAPEIIGKLLAAKDHLRQRNKGQVSDLEKAENLLMMQVLDLCIKMQLRDFAPDGYPPEVVQVCMRGKLFIHRRRLK